MKSNKLINWCELSRFLCGHKDSLKANRVPKKHAEKVNELKDAIQSWIEKSSIQPKTDELK
jgi:hypothetical protein